MAFNEMLKTIRRAQGLTQKQVADCIGVSKQTITAYEAGTREPDLMKLIALAEALGTRPDVLLERVEEATPPNEKAPAQEAQELTETDEYLIALPEPVKQTVRLLITQAQLMDVPTVTVSEVTDRRIDQAIRQADRQQSGAQPRRLR